MNKFFLIAMPGISSASAMTTIVCGQSTSNSGKDRREE
jgi:hypothetical protein